MAGPRSVKEIREANGGLDHLTDFDIAQHEFNRFRDVYTSFDRFAPDVGLKLGGKWGNRLSASVDNWQAGLQGVAEAVGGSMGLDGTERIFGDMRRANEMEAQNARQLARSQGAITSFKEANSIGDYADLAGGLVVDSLPYLGEALAGGLTGRALLSGPSLGLGRAAAGSVGATAASYPSAVGDILQNQRDENGTTDLGSAAAGGVPYALANGLFGIEGAIGRGRLARSGISALDDLTGVRGALARTGATAGRAALSEGLSETAQEGVNQYFGRMAVNPDETLFNPEANDRYLESFVGGATLGGLVGGGAGGWRRSEGYTPSAVDDPAKPTNLLGGTPPNLVTDMGALPPLQDRINQNLGLNLTGAPKGYVKGVTQAYDEPSGVRLPDPETGVERELTVGEALARQAEMYQAEIQGRYFTPATGTEISSLLGGAVDPLAGRLGSTLYDAPLPDVPVNLITDTSALPPLQQRIDQNLGLNLPGAPKNYPSQFQEAASEPTNQWVVDPQTGMERRLDIGQVTAIRAGDNTQLTPEQQNIKAKADELAAARTAAHNTFMGPAVDGAWPLKLQPREVSTYRTMDQLRQQGVMSQAAFEEMAGSVQEALMAEDTKTLNKINKDITAELAKRQAPAQEQEQEQVQGDAPSTQQTAPAAQPPGLQISLEDEAAAVPGEAPVSGQPEPAAQPAPAVGLQRQATAPTTPSVPAVKEQAAAPAVGTSPAADAWQQVVAQAQALQIPVPPYESLRADQQKQVEDLVAREQFNMSAANTILSVPEPAAKPAPAVGLQRKATAPTTPFVPTAEEQAAAPAAPVEPATPVAAEGQPTAPVAGTSPAVDAWQQVVAQAQALQIPVPPYESLRAGQQKQVEDLVAREQFNMSAADTVLRMPEPAAKPATVGGANARLPEKQGDDNVQTNTSTGASSLGRPGGGQAAVQGDGAVPGQVGADGGIQRTSSGGEQARGEGGVAAGAAVDGRGLKGQVRVRGAGEPARIAGGYEPGVGPGVESVLGAESENRPDVTPPAGAEAQWERLTSKYKKLPQFSALTVGQAAKVNQVVESGGKLDVVTALKIADSRVSRADAKASAKEVVVDGVKKVELPYVGPSESAAARVETEQGADFRKNFLNYYQQMEPAMQSVWRDWIGFELDSLGEPILGENGKSLATIGAELENTKSGEAGMSKQAVHKRVKKQLAELGFDLDQVDINKARERITYSLAGTDADTISRNMDMATPGQTDGVDLGSEVGFEQYNDSDSEVASIQEAQTLGQVTKKQAEKLAATVTGGREDGVENFNPEAEGMAFAKDDTDDVGAAEDAYEVDFEAARQREEETGFLRDYLKDDLAEGRVLESDIEGARYAFDRMLNKGVGAFAAQPVSKQAESARLFARARASGDPTIKKIEAILNAKNQPGARTEPAASDSETIRRGEGATQGGQPAAAGRATQAGSPVPEVQQAGGQASAPVVVAKKKRRVAAPAAEQKRAAAAPVDQATPEQPATGVVRTGVASGNEPKTNSQEKAPPEEKSPPAASGVSAVLGSDGPTTADRQQQSIGRRTAGTDRGVGAATVVEDLKRFLRKDALGHKVIVVQSVSDLPKGIKITSKKLTQGITIDAGPDGRVAYLIADNLTPSQIRPVFMHEVGSHMALDNMLRGPKMDALIDTLKQWARAGIDGSTKLEHVLARRAFDRARAAKVDPEHARSEALAYFIEEAVAAGVDPTAIKPGSTVGSFLERVMGLFAKALRLLGVNPDKLTAQDVVDMAYGAAQAELHDSTPAATGVALNLANAKFSKAAPTKPGYLSKAPSELADLASGIATSVKDWTFTRGAFTRDLLDAAAELMPSASKYLDRMQRARVESVKLEREVAAILDDAAALSATERGTGEGSVNSLIRDMTYDGKWAFKPDWLRGVTPDPVLEARFNQLSDKAQDVVMRVFRHGHETLKQVQQAATDSIKSEVEPLIAKARAEGDMKTVKELEREKVKADGKFRRLLAIRGGMPYAPLRRFGNWAVVVKSKMYQDAQARGDKGEMDRLAGDGNHYRVEFVSNRLVAAGRANRLREVVGDSSVEFFERSDENLIYGGDSMFSAFSRFRKLAREKMEGEESKVVTTLDKTLASMYMALVAETSARTSEFDRKNVAGADKDMLRSFATHGRAMANFIGSLKTSGEVMDILRVMKREAGEGGNRAEKSTLYNEILRRHAMGLNYEPNQLLDKSLAANSYWSLVTSPSYLLTNLTQPWVVSLPVLAGRFGMGRSSSEMFRAYKEIGRISSRLVDNPDAVKDLPKDVQGAVEELFNRGSIDISLGADLGAFTSGGDSKLSANLEKAIRFPRTLVERGEMVNRVATAVAAYRLAKSRGMKDEAAINYADKVIYETHGDYSAFNSPRVMRNAVGRFATQFRKFQLIQIALYARMIRDSMAKLPKSGTPEELKAATEARAVARRSLAYTLGTTFALGGLTAMPGFTAISFLMGAFGDDDEPDDPEATLRRALGGGAEADLLMRGVPNLLGMNLGNRVGAAGMLSILPYTDLEASREGYKDILMGVAGPFFGGTLPKALDGLGLIRQGDLWKGLEMLAPRGLADVSKGIRFGTEGVTKRNGDVVLSGDDVSFFAAAAQAMGLPTTTITDNQMLRNSQFTADEFYKERTGQLKRQYVQAYRSGDGAKLREIRAEWQETQQARSRLGFKVQPLSTLLKAPQEQRKREAKPLNTELVE